MGVAKTRSRCGPNTGSGCVNNQVGKQGVLNNTIY